MPSHIDHPRFGIIGLGAISQEYASALHEHQTSIKMISDENLHSSGRYLFPEAEFVPDPHALITSKEVDVVIVATPPSSHLHLCIDVLKQGKTAICEKPLTIRQSELETLSQALSYVPGRLYAAYYTKFHPISQNGTKIARKILTQTPLTSVEITYAEDVRKYHPGSSWVFDPEIAGGGCLIDSGINAISVVEQVVGHFSPLEIEALISPLFPYVETMVTACFSSQYCPQIFLNMDWLCDHEQRTFQFNYRDGQKLLIDLVAQSITVENRRTLPQSKEEERIDMKREYFSLIADVLRFLDSTTQVNVDAFEPLQTVFESYALHRASQVILQSQPIPSS